MSKFHTVQGPAQLRTEVGCTSVGGVNVEPQLFFCTCAHHHTDCIKFCCACQMEKEAFWIGLESTERRTDWSQLSQVVKGTHSCRAQRHTQLRSKRNTQTQTGWKMLAENFENFHCNLVPSLFQPQNCVCIELYMLHSRVTPISTLCQMPTIKGTNPLSLSSWMACFKVSPLRESCSSVGRNLILTRVIRPAFSTEE